MTTNNVVTIVLVIMVNCYIGSGTVFCHNSFSLTLFFPCFELRLLSSFVLGCRGHTRLLASLPHYVTRHLVMLGITSFCDELTSERLAILRLKCHCISPDVFLNTQPLSGKSLGYL